MNRLLEMSATRREGFGVFQMYFLKNNPFLKIYKYLCIGSYKKQPLKKSTLNQMEEEDKDVFWRDNNLRRLTRDSKIFSLFNSLNYNKVINLAEIKQVIEKNSVTTAYELLKKFSKHNIRNPNLLVALSNKLYDSASSLDFKQSSDVLFCISHLSFKDKKLISKITEQLMLCGTIKNEGSVAASALRSYGVLKYRNPEVLDHLIKIILEDNTSQRTKYLLNALLTLATVNYKSSHLNFIIQELSKLSSHNFNETKSYLDFVWSCVILNELSVDHIAQVLSEKYTGQLNLLGAAFGNSIPINLKLQNINSAALNLIPDYNGPVLEEIFKKPQISKIKSEFSSKVLDGLCHIFPKHGYLALNKDTNSGFLLDVECCMDSNGNPVLLKESQNLNKIGILLYDFNDYCLDDEKLLSGINCFKQRIIKALNYNLVTVSYLDFINLDKVDEKVNYLKKKLRDVYKKPNE